MDKKQAKAQDLIREEYFRIKDMLGKRPMRLDLFTYMDDDVYAIATKTARNNLFKNYLEYLDNLGELTDDEKNVYGSIGREFLNLIENTNMSKVYKMPVLMAFYNQGDVQMEVSEEQLLTSWKSFFDSGTNWKDIPNVTSYAGYKQISDKEHIKKIKEMPVHFLLESGKGLFCKKEGCVLALRDELAVINANKAFACHMKDIIDYRAMDYYRKRYKVNSGKDENNE
jgi:hypothetical protein